MADTVSVVFLGSSAFAVPALKAIAADPSFTVLLVITQPDRPVGRKQTLTPPPVKTAALELHLPVLQPESLNKEFALAKAACARPDVLVVVSYGQILSQEVLDWPSVAPVNVHASLLPELRGASPIQHAILQGKAETGVTVQRMVKELDAGPVLSRRVTHIGPRDTFVTLHDRLAELGAALVTDTLKHPHSPVEQNHAEATFCGKLEKKDGEADPKTMTAAAIDRMIRALTPWPGVTWDGNKLLEASTDPSDDALRIPCSGNTDLFVTRIQPAGGKPMSGAAFARGRSLPS